MNFTAEALKKILLQLKDEGAGDFLRDGAAGGENPGPMDEKMMQEEDLGNEIADMAPSLDKGGNKQEILRMQSDAPVGEQADIGHGDERMVSEARPDRKMSLMERAHEALKKHGKGKA